MATAQEIREALDDYVLQANKNERVRRTLLKWSCVIHLSATDTQADFTLIIKNGEMDDVIDGLKGVPDLIVKGKSEDLTDIFWGDQNPASNYMQGAIQVQGSSDDVLRLDSITMFVFLENQQ